MELQPIQSKIYEIRGQRVMLDFDLAELYQVETKRLKEAVRRNIERFEGDDFMFVLSEKEYEILRTQIATSSLTSQNASSNWGGRRYMPFAFTEMGVAMLSSVLRSETAIRVNRAIMRAFVAMRNYITTTTQITAELAEIRAKLALLERADADNAEAVSDLSEDMRQELDNIYQAIAALSIKVPQARPADRVQADNKEIADLATLALWRVYASPVRRSSKFRHSRTQIRSIKDKESRSNSRLSSFRRYSVACIITRSVPRHSFTVRLPMDWMILAASGSRTTEIGCVAVVISLPLVVTS